MRSKFKYIFYILFVANIGLLAYLYHHKTAAAAVNNGRLHFDFLSHDFGNLKPTDSANVYFRYTNISAKPVKLLKVAPVCDCTISEWSKSEIKPGASGVIKVVYDARIIGTFDRQVLVYPAGDKDPIVLTIKGKVSR